AAAWPGAATARGRARPGSGRCRWGVRSSRTKRGRARRAKQGRARARPCLARRARGRRMTTMKRFFPLGTGLAVLLAAGVVHGTWTQRWRPSQELHAAAARLNDVPLRVGDWQGRDVPMEPEVVERSGLAAGWTRH